MILNQNSISHYEEKTVTGKNDVKAQGTDDKKKLLLQQQSMLDNKYFIDSTKFGGDIYKPKGSKKTAFRDTGHTIVVKAKAPGSVAKDVVMLAETKGWKAIQINGKKEFKRDVWIEASSRGMDVYGYTPTEQDIRLVKSQKESAKKASAKTSSVPETQVKAVNDTSIQKVAQTALQQVESKAKETQKATSRATRQGPQALDLEKMAEDYAKLITKDTVSQLEIQLAIMKNFEKVKDQYATVSKQSTNIQSTSSGNSHNTKAATPKKETAQENAR